MVVTNTLNDLEIRVNNTKFEDIITLHRKLFAQDKHAIEERLMPYTTDPNAIIITAHTPHPQDQHQQQLISYRIATSLDHAPHIPPRHKQLFLSTIPARPEEILYLHYGGTAPQYQRHGLWKILINESITIAQKQGYTHLKGFFRQETSARGMKKLFGTPEEDFLVEIDNLQYNILTYPIPPTTPLATPKPKHI
jgi:GNAT superfamily N-acetyltransferase